MTSRYRSRRHNAQTQEKVHRTKLVVVGDTAVGKTNLTTKFAMGVYNSDPQSTIGAAFVSKSVVLDDVTVKFDIWDTAGQEKYHSLVSMYYRGARAALVVYDITDIKSFQRAKFWVDELLEKAEPGIFIALVGNKADLDRNRTVEYKEGKDLAEHKNLLFMETSAKTGMNVNEVFHAVAEKIKKAAESSREVFAEASQSTGQNTRGTARPHTNIQLSESESKQGCCKKQ